MKVQEVDIEINHVTLVSNTLIQEMDQKTKCDPYLALTRIPVPGNGDGFYPSAIIYTADKRIVKLKQELLNLNKNNPAGALGRDGRCEKRTRNLSKGLR